MGAICSKQSTLSGGHTLGPSASSSPGQPRTSSQGRSGRSQQQTPAKQRPQRPQAGPSEARRSQAAAAAEQRKKNQSKRGVNVANPNSGRLAARLEASKTAPPEPEPTRRQDTVIDDWRS